MVTTITLLVILAVAAVAFEHYIAAAGALLLAFLLAGVF